MIPLRDVIPSRTRPFVTVTLILINAAVFLWALLRPGTSIGIASDMFATSSWVTVPATMFLHGGWLHLLSNLLALWIVGGNVEDRMGHGRYLMFYLLSGAAGAGAHIWNAPDLVLPPAGASGAIAGLVGAYLVLFPNSRVLVLVPAWKAIDVIEMPALIVVALWFLVQMASGFGADTGAGGLTQWILAGGLAAGLALVWVFRRREREKVEWWSSTNK